MLQLCASSEHHPEVGSKFFEAQSTFIPIVQNRYYIWTAEPNIKDYSALGSILGSPYFGKLNPTKRYQEVGVV